MNELSEIRKKINDIDTQILELLSERMEQVSLVAQIKKRENLPVLDPKREQEFLEYLYDKAEKMGLQKTLVEKIWKNLFTVSQEYQHRIIKEA